MADSTVNVSSTLKRRITVYNNVEQDDGLGGYFVNWVLLGKFWAEVKAYNSGLKYDLERRSSSLVYKITLRFNESIVVGQKIVFDGHNMIVNGVLHDTNGRVFSVITAEERDSDC